MSRAFVRESDFPQLPELPAQPSPLPPGTRNLLTARGAQRLREELARLLTVARPTLASAPADDTDAKRELQVLDQRIRYLQQSLATADVITLPAGPLDAVCFGATVDVRDASGDERYRIVGVDEADAAHGGISWLSPLARALLQARVGHRVMFKTPSGVKELEVRGIFHEP